MESEQFFLKWNNFENNLTSGFADLFQQEAMVDVTLAVEGKIVQAHKIILSICSSYFRNMFQMNPCQHPIVVLKDVGYQELTDMLDFMYKGEASVRQQDLPSFLKLAETLKVKGLAGNSSENDNHSINNKLTVDIPSIQKKMSCKKEEITTDEDMDECTLLRKKRKRLISPCKNSNIKPLLQCQNIMVETKECNVNAVDNKLIKVEGTVVMEEERLTDNDFDSHVEGNSVMRNENVAGPSEDNFETVPQDMWNPRRTSKPLSVIWSFFNFDCLENKSECKLCGKIFKASPKTGTASVKYHLHFAHQILRNDGVKTFEPAEYKFVETCFGGHLLILNGFSYRRKSIAVERSYWFCAKSKCPAKGILHSNGTFQLTHLIHNHKSNYDEIERREKLLELKKLAINLNVSGQDLLRILDIKEDVKKYLSFIRTWRCRNKKQKPNRRSSGVEVGLNYRRPTSHLVSEDVILHLGYMYKRDSRNSCRENCKYWRCMIKQCKARAETDESGKLIVFNSRHLHPPPLSREPVRQTHRA